MLLPQPKSSMTTTATTEQADVVIIGAGAAGLMAAATAGHRGRRVLLLEHANKPGKKILMSGGTRCNFTNLNAGPQHFTSRNPHFCKSALSRYTPWDFLDLVQRHGVAYKEKAAGQLFCATSAKDILKLLLAECDSAGVDLRLNTEVHGIRQHDGFMLDTSAGRVHCDRLVIATGGLSIPRMGAGPFGYQVAEQFGLKVLPTRAGLVPFTLHPEDKEWLAPLSGISCDASVSAGGRTFAEPILITHRGLSGPAMLQASSFWEPGTAVTVNWLPGCTDVENALQQQRTSQPSSTLEQWLRKQLPQRLADAFVTRHDWTGPLQHYTAKRLADVAQMLTQWTFKPAGTEGYRTAEVTLGGVDTDGISSKTFEAKTVPGLHFIGEVLDVTGQLGGFNFQWAWASGQAAGKAV
ncbi:MAG TPA: NAD(P)/FAD-dependent oxidoreductase [Rhodanobacteraceae bacterium]